MKIALSALAVRDLENAYRYLNEQSQSAGDRFLSSFEAELELLQGHPFLGRRRHFKKLGVRSWRVRGFESFLIFYFPGDKTLDVIRVLHGARDVAELV